MAVDYDQKRLLEEALVKAFAVDAQPPAECFLDLASRLDEVLRLPQPPATRCEPEY